MSSPLIKSYDKRPPGLDFGLLCLAGVTLWTMAVKIFLPAASHTHDKAVILVAMLSDFIGLLILFIASVIVWIRSNKLSHPPRRWALLLALVWTTGQIAVWLSIIAHGHNDNEQAAIGKSHPPLFSNRNYGITLAIGGSSIALPQGWQMQKFHATAEVQYRAINPQTKVTLNAGAFRSNLPLESYFAVSVAAAQQSPYQAYEGISTLTGVEALEIQKALESPPGSLALRDLRQAYDVVRFEIRDAKKSLVLGIPIYEIQGTGMQQGSTQTSYIREFFLAGKLPDELIKVTFVSRTGDLFQDPNLINTIQVN